MCTLHLFHRVFPDTPVLFAANRDEDLDRPWAPPAVLADKPWCYGPRDLTAGGTWLGVNQWGVLASLANHYGTLRGGSASLCSRGTVVLDALRHANARAAMEAAVASAPVCKSYTLLLADPEAAYVVDQSAEGTHWQPLETGCHVITNERFGDPQDAKAIRCRARMGALRGRPTPEPADLFTLLSDHQPAATGASPLCIHPAPGSRFGTSSASVIAIDPARKLRGFWFAPGPPCTTQARDYAPDETAKGAPLMP